MSFFMSRLKGDSRAKSSATVEETSDICLLHDDNTDGVNGGTSKGTSPLGSPRDDANPNGDSVFQQKLEATKSVLRKFPWPPRSNTTSNEQATSLEGLHKSDDLCPAADEEEGQGHGRSQGQGQAQGQGQRHHYQSLAELTRGKNRSWNRSLGHGLEGSRSSANVILDRMSCSCFGAAVVTIAVVSLISVASILVTTDEHKEMETQKLVQRIQNNGKSVLDKGLFREAAVGNVSLAPVLEPEVNLAPAMKPEMKAPSAAGKAGASLAPDTINGKAEPPLEALAPGSIVLLKKAEALNVPKKVEAEGDKIQRTIIDLSPKEKK